MTTRAPMRAAAIGLVLMVAACGAVDDARTAPSPATTTSAAAETTSSAPSPSGASSTAPTASTAPTSSGSEGSDTSSAPAEATIPEALHGTWAQIDTVDGERTEPTEKQCDPAYAFDAAITVDATSIGYFESRAVLESVIERDSSRLEGVFSKRVGDSVDSITMSLDAQDGGRTLIVRELDADAAPGPLPYLRCPD